MLDTPQLTHFRDTVYAYYRDHARPMAWRDTTDPYRILVSEIMLQQTQVDRVRDKYDAFIAAFPTFNALDEAPFAGVFTVWQGLGYNRRAKALKEIARIVVHELGGALPETPEELEKLPGIGPATAASISAFAYNRPVVFIETNIRSVFIHHFFGDRTDVHDNEILPLVDATLDRKSPRKWYYALMDYGVMLKKAFGNPSRKSRHHGRQSPFEGSDRQIRGRILRHLAEHPGLPENTVIEAIDGDNERVAVQLASLRGEGFIEERDGGLSLG